MTKRDNFAAPPRTITKPSVLIQIVRWLFTLAAFPMLPGPFFRQFYPRQT